MHYLERGSFDCRGQRELEQVERPAAKPQIEGVRTPHVVEIKSAPTNVVKTVN